VSRVGGTTWMWGAFQKAVHKEAAGHATGPYANRITSEAEQVTTSQKTLATVVPKRFGIMRADST